MPKGNKQKIKLVCLIKYLMEQTDEEHKVTMADILGYLEGEDIKAERKSIYSDMETLRELGIDVVGEKIGKGFHYYVASREFEVAELKLLVDAIQSSKFITQKKSEILSFKVINYIWTVCNLDENSTFCFKMGKKLDIIS